MFCYRCKYKYIFANPRFLQENIFVWGQESRCGRCFGVFALSPILFTMSFPPPSRNPGWLYAWYCVALLPRRCPSSPTPPRVPHQVRDDGALRRCAIALPLHSRPHSHSVIPASERESWAALCAVLRCTIASPVSIPANASQGPASSAG